MKLVGHIPQPEEGGYYKTEPKATAFSRRIGFLGLLSSKQLCT